MRFIKMLVLCTILIGFSQVSNAQCSSSFYFEHDTTGTFSYNFINSSNYDSTGSAFTWLIDGNPMSTTKDFNHSFPDTGWYEVSLIINDQMGCGDTSTQNIHVEDHQGGGCFADFYEQQDQNDPFKYFFNNTSSIDSTTATYEWWVDNNMVSNQKDFDYTFSAEGNYNVCLYISDQGGCQNNHCRGIDVGTQGGGCQVYYMDYQDSLDSKTYTFEDQSGLPTGTTYEWLVNGSVIGSGMNYTHTFPDTGEYDVCLRVNTPDSCMAEDCRKIYVGDHQGGDCFAAYTPSPISNDGMSWEFMDNSYASGGIQSFTYTTGDGYTYTESNSVHQYANEGSYNVCLVIQSFDGCSDSICNVIDVVRQNDGNGGDGDDFDPLAGCGASFLARQDTQDPFMFDFKNISEVQDTNNVSVTWTINGQVYNSIDAQHRFTVAGTYSVCLEVNSNGCISSSCMDIVAGDLSCAVGFTTNVDPQNPKRVQFILSRTDNLTGGYWTFGDGGTAEETHPIHEFAHPGFYDVCINGFDQNSGCQVQYCQPIAVDGGGSTCFADFDYQIGQNGEVTFSNNSQGGFNKVQWKFGNGSKSSSENPVHIYTASGVYDVCLTITDTTSNCVSEACVPISVQLDTTDIVCNAKFNFFPEDENTFRFQNASTGTFDKTDWDFGGNGTKSGDVVTFDFGPGYHTVCLTILDSASGCIDDVCETIVVEDTAVVNCHADFNFIVEGNTVRFSNKSQGNYTNMNWILGNGRISNASNPVQTYTSAGHYDVCLSVYDSASGCQDQICKMVAIAPDTNTVYCEAKFNIFNKADGEVVVKNNSIGNVTNAHWMFNDIDPAYGNEVDYVFGKSGSKEICLTVWDSVSGCQASLCKNVLIELDTADVFCKADFDFMVLDDGYVSFKNTSLGSYNSWFWNLSSGNTSRAAGPVRQFKKSGFFPVQLTVVDTNSGCMSQVVKDVQITLDTTEVNCKAEFDAFIDVNRSAVNFLNTSVGTFNKVSWSFDNGQFASANNAYVQYQREGEYDVCLTVLDTVSGCQDRYCTPVRVKQPRVCKADFYVAPSTEPSKMIAINNSEYYTESIWEYGDGSFGSDSANTSHEYANPGYKNVCLSVYDAATGCKDELCKEVLIQFDTTIVEDCKGRFDWVQMNDSVVRFTSEYVANPGAKVTWNTPTGKVSTDSVFDYTFRNNYKVDMCFTLYDPVTGCIDRSCEMAEVQVDTAEIYCEVDFDAFVQGNKEVAFSADVKGSSSSILWDMGDGYTYNDSSLSHTFVKPGVNKVCLTSIYFENSELACLDVKCKDVVAFEAMADDSAIAQEEICNADFVFFPGENLEISFKDKSSENASGWYWDFGNGDSASVEQNPIYTFDEAGFYEVCMTMKTSNGCQETYCEIIPVGDVSDACFSRYDYFADKQTATAHFKNQSLGTIDSYYWDFGDSTSSVQKNPSHTYADTGYYAVCLTVSNDSGYARTYCNDIRVGNALENKCLIGCVWPGDANTDLEANHYDIFPIGLNFGQSGPARQDTGVFWKGYKAQNWSTNLQGDINNKHGDCNGDGVIDFRDMSAVIDNFAFSRPWQPKAAGKQLSVDLDVDDLDIGETAVMTVSLADTLNTSMYGIGFELELDPNVFDFSTAVVDFSGSWLGTEDQDLLTFSYLDESLGFIYISESRNDQANQNGTGELVKIYIQTKAGGDGTYVNLSSNGGVDNTGDTLSVNGNATDANVNSIEEREGYSVKELVVYPNPSTGNVQFALPTGTTEAYQLQVFDNVGKLVLTETIANGGVITKDLSAFDSGIYTIQVNHNKVKYVQKVILTK